MGANLVHPALGLVLGYGDRVSSLLVVLRGKLRRPKFERQLVDCAIKGERQLVVVVVRSCAAIVVGLLK